MIITIDSRFAVAVERDLASARYVCAEILADVSSAVDLGGVVGGPVRAVVELKRNFGGMIMRAQLGGEFLPGGGQTRYEVCVAAEPFDSGLPATCESFLGDPLIPGLPSDFARSALAGVTASSARSPLPGGVLRVDRAGYDLMGSSESAFNQAGRLLRHALVAMIQGVDLEARVREAIEELS
jgi:hypothetical protein